MTEKSLFQEIRRYATELSKEEDITKAFPYLCLKIYFSKLSDEDIDNALSGLGSNDESIDAFWIDDEDQIINIVQFKSSVSEKKTRENMAQKGWFSFLADIDNKLKDDNFLKNCKNQRIKNGIAWEYRQAKHSGYTCKRYLFHLGNCTEAIVQNYKDIIEYFSCDDIYEKFREFKSMTSFDNPKDISPITLEFPNTNIKYLKYQAQYNGIKDTYVVILTGKDLIKLRKEHRYQLFNRNVRYFLGETNIVNKEIIKTAINNPEIFYCFNNGITITCSQCTINKNNVLRLIYPQIINGAQTVNSLYSAYEKMVKERKKGRTPQDTQEAELSTLRHFEDIKVLCRIVTSTKGEQTDFARKLTEYTNKQNDVKVFDFCANRPEQREIQKKMAKYGYFYERKRGEREYCKKNKIPHEDLKMLFDAFQYKDIKINIQILAGVYQAYLGKPSYVEVDYKTILSNCSGEDYKTIFGTNITDVTDEKVKSMILAINIYNIIDKHVKDYEKANKAWLELLQSSSDDIKIKNFKDKVSKIEFLNMDLKDDINKINKFDETTIKEVNQLLINKYGLFTRSKYMFTGLIKFILDKNEYTQKILDNDLYSNVKYLNSNFITWIRPIMTDVIKAVYNEMEKSESMSMEKFYKKVGIFGKLISKINDLRYDRDDWSLKQKFKLDNI